MSGTDETEAVVARSMQEHMRAPFPARLRGADRADIDMVLLDADIAGCVSTWLGGGGSLDAARHRMAAPCCAPAGPPPRPARDPGSRVSLAPYGRHGTHDMHDQPSGRQATMAKTTKVPTALVAAAGLVGGYGVARWSRNRQLGGAVLAVAGTVAAQRWREQAGVPVAGALTVAYVAAFAGSHPLAKKVGAWPAVFGVAGAVAIASWAVADRR